MDFEAFTRLFDDDSAEADYNRAEICHWKNVRGHAVLVPAVYWKYWKWATGKMYRNCLREQSRSVSSVR